MSQDQQEILEQQLKWTTEQILILDEIDVKLHEMKKIAEYVIALELSEMEMEKMNNELQVLKIKVDSLYVKLYPILH